MKFEELELLDAIKTALIATQSVQDDYRFNKWARYWLHNVDRTMDSAKKLQSWHSPAGKCAKAAIEYNKWIGEENPEYKKIYEKLARQFCVDTILVTSEKWGLTLNLEEFIPELEKYPEIGPRKAFDVDGTFKVSEEEKKAKLKEFKYCCEICKEHVTNVRGYGLVSDHDHATGLFRGLICTPCNSMLGFAKDKSEILINAAKYLDKYKELHQKISDKNIS